MRKSTRVLKTGIRARKASGRRRAKALPVGRLLEFRQWIRLGHLRFEKCELREAEEAFLEARKWALNEKRPDLAAEALSGLMRCAGEALDQERVKEWDNALDHCLKECDALRLNVPPSAWYIKGAVAVFREEWKLAQRHFHRTVRSLRACRNEDWQSVSGGVESWEQMYARTFTMLAVTQLKRGHIRRSRLMAVELLRRWETSSFRGVNGVLYLLIGGLEERERRLDEAMRWYQKAHGAFMQEHNWYHHLYVLYHYARIARFRQNYSQAYWYLDLVDKAAPGKEFGVLRRAIKREWLRLEEDAVDLLIDSRKGVVQTREQGKISLRKQYVLMDILRALTQAHGRAGEDSERGLSKAEIIEKVWNESYRPEAHDNKLYYNINRLRKLIEPDVRQPQYLLNWKEGYRLAPGLRIQFIGGQSGIEREGGNLS